MYAVTFQIRIPRRGPCRPGQDPVVYVWKHTVHDVDAPDRASAIRHARRVVKKVLPRSRVRLSSCRQQHRRP